MKKIIIFLTVFFTLIGFSYASEVNIFSARHYDSDVQLYGKFTAKTGIKVNVVSGKDKALQKKNNRRRKRLRSRSLYYRRCWKIGRISTKENVPTSKLFSFKKSNSIKF